MAERACLRLAHPPQPPPAALPPTHPPLISFTCDITVAAKNCLKNHHKVGKKSSVKADLAIYSHIVDASGQCMSESLILGHNLDFSSCHILVGFCKSSHIQIPEIDHVIKAKI